MLTCGALITPESPTAFLGEISMFLLVLVPVSGIVLAVSSAIVPGEWLRWYRLPRAREAPWAYLLACLSQFGATRVALASDWSARFAMDLPLCLISATFLVTVIFAVVLGMRAALTAHRKKRRGQMMGLCAAVSAACLCPWVVTHLIVAWGRM